MTYNVENRMTQAVNTNLNQTENYGYDAGGCASGSKGRAESRTSSTTALTASRSPISTFPAARCRAEARRFTSRASGWTINPWRIGGGAGLLRNAGRPHPSFFFHHKAMTTHWTAFLLGCLLPVGAAHAQLPDIRVGTRNMTAKVYRIRGEDVDLSIQFDAIVGRRASGILHVASEPAIVIGVDRLRGESWTTLYSGHWEDIGQERYKACSSGPQRDGDVFIVPNIRAAAFFKTDDAEARSHMVLRFHFLTVCREGDTKFHQFFFTEPVDVKIPRWDDHGAETPKAEKQTTVSTANGIGPRSPKAGKRRVYAQGDAVERASDSALAFRKAHRVAGFWVSGSR